jgi:hypothetical protein
VGNFYANLDCGTGLPSPERRCCGPRLLGAGGCARGPGSSRDALLQRVGILGGTRLAPDTVCMAKKPEPPKPTTWTIYKLAAKAERLGTVEAPD